MADRSNYLLVQQQYRLNHACRAVTAAGFDVYQVGSSLTRPDYRDVDLRCIMIDREYDALIEGNHERLMLLNAALSEWLANATGLPIDFQFQRMTQANKEFNGQRNYCGMQPERST